MKSCRFQSINERTQSVSATSDELVKITVELANIYHLVCEVNGDTPNRVMLEHVQGRKAKREQAAHSGESSDEKSRESTPGSESDASVTSQNKDGGDPMECMKLTETVHDQIKYLRRATVHQSLQHTGSTCALRSGPRCPPHPVASSPSACPQSLWSCQ